MHAEFPSGSDMSDNVMIWRYRRTRFMLPCSLVEYRDKGSVFIMHRSYGPRSLILIVSENEIERLCWYRNCRTDVIQVGVRYGMGIPGCSRSGSEIPDSICEYLRFNIMSFPASV